MILRSLVRAAPIAASWRSVDRGRSAAHRCSGFPSRLRVGVGLRPRDGRGRLFCFALQSRRRRKKAVRRRCAGRWNRSDQATGEAVWAGQAGRTGEIRAPGIPGEKRSIPRMAGGHLLHTAPEFSGERTTLETGARLPGVLPGSSRSSGPCRPDRKSARAVHSNPFHAAPVALRLSHKRASTASSTLSVSMSVRESIDGMIANRVTQGIREPAVSTYLPPSLLRYGSPFPLCAAVRRIPPPWLRFGACGHDGGFCWIPAGRAAA